MMGEDELMGFQMGMGGSGEKPDEAALYSDEDRKKLSRDPANANEAAPSYQEVLKNLQSGNKQEAKVALADHAGVPVDAVNDKNLTKVNSSLRGAQVASARGSDPTKMDVDSLSDLDPKKPAQAEKEESPEDKDHQTLLMTSLAAALPSLVGYAFGGYAGGAAGASAGATAANQIGNYYQTEPDRKLKMAEFQQKTTDLARSKAESDPTSEVSAKARASAKVFLEEANPKLAAAIRDDMSARDVGEITKELGGRAITAELAIRGRDATNDRIRERNDILKGNQDIARQRLGMGQDRLAAQAVDRIHRDPQIVQMEASRNLVDRGRMILNKPDLTNQEFNDVQIELSNAIAGARSAALGKLERTEYDTMNQRWADLKQKISGKPTDAVTPEIKARVTQLANETYATIAKHQGERAKTLSRGYRNTPAAQSEQDAAVQKYQDIGTNEMTMQKGKAGLNDAHAGGGAVAPADRARLLQHLKDEPNDPRNDQIRQLLGM